MTLPRFDSMPNHEQGSMQDNWWQDFGSLYPRSAIRSWCDTDRPRNHSSSEHSTDAVQYNFNEHGLRSGPLVNVPGKINILVSGCSHTLGIGIPESDTWPQQLCGLIDNSVIHNVAIGGASTDYVARSVYIATRLIKIDLIFLLWPDSSRLEYFDSAPHNIQVTNPQYPKLFLHDVHHHHSWQKNIILSRLAAQSIPIYHAGLALGRSPDSVARARDGVHNCPMWHRSVAQGFHVKHQENDQHHRFATAQHIIDHQALHDHS